jgi:hypothetical protein
MNLIMINLTALCNKHEGVYGKNWSIILFIYVVLKFMLSPNLLQNNFLQEKYSIEACKRVALNGYQ